VRCASRYTLTTAMSSHKTCLICCCRSGCTLLHLGLGQILAVNRDIGPTLGTLKDSLVSLILQRCCGPCMWRALLRHGTCTSPDSSRVLSSAAPGPFHGEPLPSASRFPTLSLQVSSAWRAGHQDVPHLMRGRARTDASTMRAWNLVTGRIYAADCTAIRLGCAAAVFGICTSSTPAL
jgi:hypothetical protein